MAHQHQHMTGSHRTLGLLVPLGCAHTEEPQSLEQNERATGTTTTAQGSGPTWMPYLAPMTERSVPSAPRTTAYHPQWQPGPQCCPALWTLITLQEPGPPPVTQGHNGYLRSCWLCGPSNSTQTEDERRYIQVTISKDDTEHQNPDPRVEASIQR